MELFIEIGLILVITLLVVGILRIFKQPMIIGYIIAGIALGPYFLNIVSSVETLSVLSQIGIALLLFIVGLSLSPKVLKEVGKVSIITGLGQIIFTSVIGFLIAKFMGFTTTASLYIAVALTFSSTIIIMKILSDKKDLNTLYGKISVGFLIVQDLVAVIILIIISSLPDNGTSLSSVALGTIFKGAGLLVMLFLVSIYVIPKTIRFIAESQELLLLFSITWCLALASLFHYFGLSIEVGALLAGVSLSLTNYRHEIGSKMKPLRDFFIVLFFILLGSQMVFMNITPYILPIVVFSLFILIGNPLIVMIILGLFGHTKRNAFLSGLTVAQISEFSLILIILGVKMGHLTNEILSMVTAIGLITIAGSTYMMLYSNTLYSYLSKYLQIFERKHVKYENSVKENYKAILFGYNRIGFGILKALKRIHKKYLVVDFNPDTVNNLSKLDIPCVYGDVYDSEFLESLDLEKLELAVSTIPDVETNILLIEEIRKVNKDAIIIVRAHQIRDALDLYKQGATYVLTPHFLGGEYVSKMIGTIKTDKEGYKEERKRHISMLIEMLEKGKEHPEIEREHD